VICLEAFSIRTARSEVSNPTLCDVSGKFGQMSAFLKLQIICDNFKLGGMHDEREKVQDFA